MRPNVSTHDRPRPGAGSHRLGLATAAGVALLAWAGAVAPMHAAARATLAPPKAYVALYGDNAVAVIDTGTNRVVKTIPVPPGPEGLVASPDGARVYASSTSGSTVSVISTATDRVVSTIEVGKNPQGLAITRDGRQVLVAVFGASDVAVIDTIRNQVIARIPVGNPHTVAISPDDHTAYVTAQQPGAAGLAILDLATRQRVGMVPLDKTPRAANFSPDGAVLYFTQAGVNAVQVLDPTRNVVVAQIPTGASPHLPIFTATGAVELTVVQGPGELALVNPSTRTIIGTVAVGKFPHWAAPTADGGTAYVTNEGANSVSVVDLEKQKVLATIPVGAAPRKIVLQPVPTSKARSLTAPAPGATPSIGQAGSAPIVAAAPAASGGVRVKDFAFAPATIRVTVGETITWINADAIPHTSTSADQRWNSGPIQPGTSFTVTFDQAGTYEYACMIHPFMHGTITVGN